MPEPTPSKYALKKRADHLRNRVSYLYSEDLDHVEFRWQSRLTNLARRDPGLRADRIKLLEAEIVWLQEQIDKHHQGAAGQAQSEATP